MPFRASIEQQESFTQAAKAIKNKTEINTDFLLKFCVSYMLGNFRIDFSAFQVFAKNAQHVFRLCSRLGLIEVGTFPNRAQNDHGAAVAPAATVAAMALAASVSLAISLNVRPSIRILT